MTTAPFARDDALDATRALAILGMFIVHAVLVLAHEVPTDGVGGLVLWWCDGRAAATFVTLAGIGVARLVASAASPAADHVLRRRALLLAGIGVVNHALWPGDILRVYGVALAVSPWLVRLPIRTRGGLAVGLVLLFPLLMTQLDWTAHWQLETLTYVGAWTPVGFVRNLLYDGFRPVVPWLAFFLFGTVLAGYPLREARIWSRMLVVGAVLTAGSVAFSARLDVLVQRHAPGLDALTREGLVGTTSLPPLPLFMLSAVGTTCLLLGTMLALTPRLPAPLVAALVATGRRALTWYLVHIVVLVVAYTVGIRGLLPALTSIGVAVAAFAAAGWWSWTHRGSRGWCEAWLRKHSTPPVAGRSTDARAPFGADGRTAGG